MAASKTPLDFSSFDGALVVTSEYCAEDESIVSVCGTLKDARAHLVEGKFNFIIIIDLLTEGGDELKRFLKGCSAHPALSSVPIYASTQIKNVFDVSDDVLSLDISELNVGDGVQSSVKREEGRESVVGEEVVKGVDLGVMDELKKNTAKVLVQIEDELSEKSLDSKMLKERYLELLSEEL